MGMRLESGNTRQRGIWGRKRDTAKGISGSNCPGYNILEYNLHGLMVPDWRMMDPVLEHRRWKLGHHSVRYTFPFLGCQNAC